MKKRRRRPRTPPAGRKWCWRCQAERPERSFNRRQEVCRPCGAVLSALFRRRHPGYAARKGREAYRREENAARYARYRENFLARNRAARLTARPRLLSLLTSARGRAKRKGLGYSLSPRWISARFEEQEGRCLLTGIAFDFAPTSRSRHFAPWSPSIHRKNPDLGYTPRNAVIVCTAVNLAINRFTEEEFARVCRAFLRRRRKK